MSLSAILQKVGQSELGLSVRNVKIALIGLWHSNNRITVQQKNLATIWHPTRLLMVKSSRGKEKNIIQPGMPSPERELRRASPQMEESLNGKREVDSGTMTELFYRHAPSLFAYSRQHMASREDAEDLLHEVFAAALEQPEFGLLSDSEQVLWLWRVARNKIIDAYRRKTRRPSLALNYVADELFAGNEQSPEYAALRHEEYIRLLATLEQLPTLQQEALRLRFVNELSCAEVAKALGKREGTVRSILSRALARLRTIYTNKKEG